MGSGWGEGEEGKVKVEGTNSAAIW